MSNQYAMGARVRPRDEAEDKYRRALHAPPPSTANLNEPVLLVSEKGDPRPAPFNQGGQGSCAACSSAKAVETAHNVVRLAAGKLSDAQAINPGPIYEKARLQHGWFPNDTGSYPADCLDLIRTGVYLLSDDAYVDVPSHEYPNATLHTELDYELAHEPFYSNLLEHIWLSLREGLPVVLCCWWFQEWFSPRGGKVQAGLTRPMNSGHATYAWGYVPGWVLLRNSWGPGWSPDAAQFGFYMQPGDFAVPAEYFTREGSPFWEARTVSPEPIKAEPEPKPKPKPEPDPDPEPDPTASAIVFKVKYKPGGQKIIVIGDGFHSQARVSIDGKEFVPAELLPEWLSVKVALTKGSHAVRVINPGALPSNLYLLMV